MLKKLLAGLLCLTLFWTMWGEVTPRHPHASIAIAATSLQEGQYPVQQAEYNDANGEYTLMLLNTPRGQSPRYTTSDLQMMSLTEEEVSAGQRSYFNLENGQAVLHLAQDFHIEYVHNVTETQTNPQTGQTETVVVRRESSFWTPFAGAIAGQVVANMLFAPHYYVPPMYQPGGMMTGYGGYGTTYSQAVNRYQKTYNEPPAAVKNRQQLRTTGSLRNSTKSRNSNKTKANTRRTRTQTRSTGSGFGSSRLRGNTNSRSTTRKRTSGFGSGRSSSRSRVGGFGRRRR
ncbi:MAG: hypothetical protein J7641_17125 [Cyanobacteria bacterium SID2]|nr:hypothetical protein [Cyanobacteria bacterium SID2]MBP0005047.1 hypothetical protein [Cyanobacteria bacterium SBC]